MRLCHLAALLFSALLSPAVASALGAQAGAVIHGQVVDQQSGEGVPLARVLVDGAPAARADTTGHFSVGRLVAGEHLVRVERAGYRAAELVAVASDSLYVIVEVEATADTLTPLLVTTQTGLPAGMGDLLKPFYWRYRHTHGDGTLIPPEEMRAISGTPRLVDVLRRLRGVHIIHQDNTMEDFLANSEHPGPHALSQPTEPCYAQIFMNGVQMYARGHGNPLNLNNFGTSDVVALEYYPTLTFTPVQFRTVTADCGTLLLWTRADPKQ